MELLFRINGTVIMRIWWQILILGLYTAVIVAVHKYSGFQISFPMTLIPVLGVVTGLLLVFRTNTAYDRYWEGRKLWGTMTTKIRLLTQSIWVMVKEPEGSSQEVIEKTSAINLLIAFAFATKNYLREEYSYDEEDLKELINHFPSNQPVEEEEEVCKGRNINPKPRSATTKAELRRASSSIENIISKSDSSSTRYTAYDSLTPTNIPLQLTHHIASYLKSIQEREIVDGTTLFLMHNSLAALVDCLTSFERILRTPIPLAYSVHLHQAVWLYLLALPYQLLDQLNWFTIPVVVLASFSLLGILGIGWEIENPFGYDENDLPLDDFCNVIRKELQTIMSRKVPKLDTWLLSSNNHPLLPQSTLTASDLISMSEPEVRKILASTKPTFPGIETNGKDNSFSGITIQPTDWNPKRER